MIFWEDNNFLQKLTEQKKTTVDVMEKEPDFLYFISYKRFQWSMVNGNLHQAYKPCDIMNITQDCRGRGSLEVMGVDGADHYKLCTWCSSKKGSALRIVNQV